MDATTEEVKSALLEAIENDQLVLPTLPEIALQVRDAANDPNTDIKRLNTLISNDAALSARVLRVANSPLVRGSQTIDNLPSALGRLGVSYSCNLVIGLAMEQMFQATNEVIDARMREVWSRSAEVAAIASVLAQHYTKLEADKATLARLTHLIGVLPILTYAEENEVLLDGGNSEQPDQLIADLSPMIGEKILATWKFPESLWVVPQEHLDLQRDSSVTDYVDVVIVARLQSYGYGSDDADTPHWQDIPAFAKLGLDMSEESIELDQLSEDISMATQVLQ